MLMKDGTSLPQYFTDAISKDTYVLRVFMEMEPGYQSMYVSQLKRSDYGDSTRERLERTISDIRKFGESRGIK